jgi:hypothetical protein
MAVWYIGAGSGDGNPYGNMIATIILGRIRWKDGLDLDFLDSIRRPRLFL